MSRVTPLITFNLYERGRQHTGHDRSDVDIQAWINLINAPETQEMIATGGMFGYYGHQIRQLFGTAPPETALLNGKEYRLSPALRTVELFADENGDVSHRIEFLETDAGEHAFRQYKAKIGGFSMAIDADPINGIYHPTLIGGFDYVFQQNYVHNCGNGQFDSALQNPAVRGIIEESLAGILDSISTSNLSYLKFEEANDRLLQAMEVENEYLIQEEKLARKKQLQAEKQAQLLDSALCPTIDIDAFLSESEAFMNAEMAGKEEQQKNKKAAGVIGGFFNYF